MGRKSTAQPRPKVQIPPKGIGPIRDPNENDVLCGRGGRINAHEGNIQFREIVASRKKDYLAKSTKKLEKAHIAASIVSTIRNMNPQGRFLKEDAADGMWYDIGDAKAIKKAGQALREDAPGIRTELDDKSSSEDEAQQQSPKPPANNKVSPAEAASPNLTQTANSPPPNVAPPTHPPAGFVNSSRGPVQSQQQHAGWNIPRPHAAAAMAPSYQPYPPQQGYMQHHPHSPTSNYPPSYRVPAQFYARPQGQSALSPKAMEVMATAPHPGAPHPGAPQDVAFGRHFTPTEMSSGSAGTVSTISGLSGLSGATSGMKSQLSGRSNPDNRSLRLSQVSELTYAMREDSLRLSGMSRSNSFPELTTIMRSSLSDESVAAFAASDPSMSGASLVPQDPLLGRPLSGHRSSDKSGSSGSSRSITRGLAPLHPVRNRSASGASIRSRMSVESTGSRLSNVMSVGSTTSWMEQYADAQNSSSSGSNPIWGDQGSTRSITSDISYEMLALDLAE